MIFFFKQKNNELFSTDHCMLNPTITYIFLYLLSVTFLNFLYSISFFKLNIITLYCRFSINFFVMYISYFYYYLKSKSRLIIKIFHWANTCMQPRTIISIKKKNSALLSILWILLKQLQNDITGDTCLDMRIHQDSRHILNVILKNYIWNI